MDPKNLTENAWKTVSSKFKAKDNGLLRALSIYEKLPEEKYDERLKALAAVILLADKLQKTKEVSSIPDLDKYLDNVLTTAKTISGEIKTAKASAEKKAADAK